MENTMKPLLVFAAMLPLTNAAFAETAAETFAAARLADFGAGNVEALIAQYADDAIVITPQGVLHGPQEIRPMIEGIVAEFAEPGATFNLIAQAAEGDVATFVWSAHTAVHTYDFAAETYVLEDGLIIYQTFAAQMSAN
jgi:ketosteroid isomerase-like protein